MRDTSLSLPNISLCNAYFWPSSSRHLCTIIGDRQKQEQTTGKRQKYPSAPLCVRWAVALWSDDYLQILFLLRASWIKFSWAKCSQAVGKVLKCTTMDCFEGIITWRLSLNYYCELTWPSQHSWKSCFSLSLKPQAWLAFLLEFSFAYNVKWSKELLVHLCPVLWRCKVFLEAAWYSCLYSPQAKESNICSPKPALSRAFKEPLLPFCSHKAAGCLYCPFWLKTLIQEPDLWRVLSVFGTSQLLYFSTQWEPCLSGIVSHLPFLFCFSLHLHFDWLFFKCALRLEIWLI